MAVVTSKQQTTALFLSTIVTRTRRRTQVTKKNRFTWWQTCSVPENIQFSFSCSFFYTVKLHSLTYSVWGPWQCVDVCWRFAIKLRIRMFRICGSVYIAVHVRNLGRMELLSFHASLAETHEGDNGSGKVYNHLQRERIMLYTLDSFTILHQRS